MSYLKKRTKTESIKILVELSRKCAELGGPLSNQLFRLMEDGRYIDVINFNFDYSWCFPIDDFLYARQIQGFLAKQDFLDLGVDKEEVAIKKFCETEIQCRDTNIRIDTISPSNDGVGSVLYGAQRKILKILGEVPTLDSLKLEFGPGATTSTKSLVASARTKLSSRLECSTNLVPLLGSLLEQLPMLCSIHDKHETGFGCSWHVDVVLAPGKLAFVPKTCLTDRSIVVETLLNGLGQKGIGSFMKDCLKRVGLDLTQQKRNQDLAREGSLSNELATVDLSSASDCVSRSLVWSLLPYEWACLLDAFRSDVVRYEGVDFLLEKFSSMGNAYTFELESLIFYSFAICTCEHLGLSTSDVSVYGDDIIIPVKACDLLFKVLDYAGFTVNVKKTFVDGPFRESCGADYMNGIDIRPFYLKTLIDDRTLYNMHNWFIRHGERELATICESYTHAPSRLYGPDGYGDGHLIGDWTPRLSRKQKRAGWCGGVFDSYTLKPRSFFKTLPGDYVYPTYSIYVRSDDNDADTECVMPIDSPECDMFRVRGTRGYKKLSIYTHADGIFSIYKVSS